MASLEAQEDFMENFDEESESAQVSVRLELLNQLYQDFTKIQADIERWDSGDAPLTRHLQERKEFESRYCAVKGWFVTQQVVVPVTANESIVAPPPPANFHLRLPKIDLPKFDGDYSRWLGFRDTFRSMVHDVPDIPPVAKLQFLLQSLEKDARKPFESVDIEADSYEPTWEALLKRYDNQRFLKKQLFRALYDLAPVRKESPDALHTLVDDFQRHVKALSKLGETVDTWNTPLVCILSYKLDSATLRAWEEHSSKLNDVTYSSCVDFLYQRTRILQTVSSELEHRNIPVKVAGTTPLKKQHSRSVATSAVSTPRSNPPACISCPERHLIVHCPSFQKLSVGQRRELVAQKRLCWNCFKSTHIARNCDSKFSCRHCHERHHSLLHISHPDQTSPKNTVKSTEEQTSLLCTGKPVCPNDSAHSTTEVSMPAHVRNSSTAFLSTVMLKVLDVNGNEHFARALIDSGSQSNFISKKLIHRLRLKPERANVSISGIGELATTVTQLVYATIRSNDDCFTSELEFLVLPNLTTELPTQDVDISSWCIPKTTELADPNFNISSRIDVILGVDQFHDYLMNGRISLNRGSPTLIETVFGWAVSGRWYGGTPRIPISSCATTTATCKLESLMEKFWDIESINTGRIYSADEAVCEEHYQTTTVRNDDGRYVVSLPKIQDSSIQLGESRSTAERRLRSLEHRLERDEAVKVAYHEFMDQYLRLGHMRLLEEPVDDTVQHYYVPHHPVFKASSTTTKIRVVFDASCRTSSGKSLNDILLVGPVVQEDLQSIEMRFRTKPVGIVADIEKMYRQIAVQPSDQPLTRILFRKKPSDPVSTFELQTVTYGTSSAPFLATRSLVQLAHDEGDKFPMAKAVVLEDFYVDDVISGAKTPEEAIELRRQLTAMLDSAGLPLRKWASNSSAVLADIPPDDLAIQPSYEFFDEQSVTTLGLIWEPNSDVLRFRTQLPVPASVLTRRNVLSYIAQIYDPLGLAGPVVSIAKQFMQRLWALMTQDGKSYAWDDPLPAKLQQQWKIFHNQLYLLSDVRIPRFVSVAGASSIELHFFSDASEKAYGACVYMRTEHQHQKTVVHLLAAKSRVTPLKTRHSIARLELCAAVLSTELFQKVNASLKSDYPVFFWVDSTTVLQWLKSPPSCWKVFVGNRVSKIQQATAGHPWKHVSGADNPADDISRGLAPADLLHRERWWTGPAWLKSPSSEWPIQLVENEAPPLAITEERKSCVAVKAIVANEFSDFLFGRFSAYFKLRRTVAYILRYLQALRISAARNHPTGSCAASLKSSDAISCTFLTTTELRNSEHALCRLAQCDTFSGEITALRNGQLVGKTSPMKWLNPRISNNDIVRVGGRLGNANAFEEVKHPIILSGKHPLATLLANHYHLFLLHAGPQLMMCTIRQRFWILGGRNLLRQVYHQCHVCFRRTPILVQQTTADLPTSRVTPSRPFSVSGIDYCGPVYLKGAHRKAGPVKAYIAIFVCFSTRATHIELVHDLSTAAFLAALRRFVARRGMVTQLHSDNATNFTGAANELNQLYRMLKTNEHDRKLIFDWCTSSNIEWKFIPPRAPHFGGLWEAAVKSTKNHLLKQLGTTSITQDEMLTLLAQIEMCLNSRPVTQMSTDPSDLEALTPGHFLIGSHLQALPEPDLKSTADNRLSRWHLVQKRFQQIWSRWYPEYLQQLQARSTKGSRTPVAIDVGRLVIVKDDNLPPAQWPLGRITKLHPGRDGITRVVTLRTATADSVTRPVNKIALLPMPPDDAEEERAMASEI